MPDGLEQPRLAARVGPRDDHHRGLLRRLQIAGDGRPLLAEEERVEEPVEAHASLTRRAELGQADREPLGLRQIAEAQPRQVELDVSDELEEQPQAPLEPGEHLVEEALQHLPAVHPVAAQEKAQPRPEAAQRRAVEGVLAVLPHGDDLEGAQLPVGADAHAQIERAQVRLVVEERGEPPVHLAPAHRLPERAQPPEPRRRPRERSRQHREHLVRRRGGSPAAAATAPPPAPRRAACAA